MSRFQEWSPEEAAALYGVRGWSAGYFDLSEEGDVTVAAKLPDGRVSVPLMDIVRGMGERGLQIPVLLRIENLLDAQIARLNESFRAAIESLHYAREYRGVFPIKVNQQRQARARRITPAERVQVLGKLAASLRGYTYFVE